MNASLQLRMCPVAPPIARTSTHVQPPRLGHKSAQREPTTTPVWVSRYCFLEDRRW
jgi:hypothetical protein